MKLRDLGDLEPTLDGHQVATILGISYWSLLESVKRRSCLVPPLPLGSRRLRWSTAAVLRAVGLDAADVEPPSRNGHDETPP